MFCKIEVRNMPSDPEQYVVARLFEFQLWYWGSYSSQTQAWKAAKEIG